MSAGNKLRAASASMRPRQYRWKYCCWYLSTVA